MSVNIPLGDTGAGGAGCAGGAGGAGAAAHGPVRGTHRAFPLKVSWVRILWVSSLLTECTSCEAPTC